MTNNGGRNKPPLANEEGASRRGSQGENPTDNVESGPSGRAEQPPYPHLLPFTQQNINAPRKDVALMIILEALSLTATRLEKLENEFMAHKYNDGALQGQNRNRNHDGIVVLTKAMCSFRSTIRVSF
ncbi:hypothetical protein PUN28_019433 [Cardiocondyla obscurior]|uniref:Uncharacterized protein n=1 Tax=Cardiocondyla obscurior TaxID=286306 RepID=A0AAW2ECR8_9HYME